MRHLFVLVLLIISVTVYGQGVLQLKGRIISESGEPLENVTIKIEGTSSSGVSDASGEYRVTIRYQSLITLIASRVGYSTRRENITAGPSPVLIPDLVLKKSSLELEEIDLLVVGSAGLATRIDEGIVEHFPSVNGSFESGLKTLPGVSANNELSSQYSVRGGNFDENLVYINNIEIFRPISFRNGQQEGLSFINPDLVSKALFSGGGFDSKYGDRLSSVLDIQYGRPDSSEFIVRSGLLGSSAAIKYLRKRNYFLVGLRNKTNTTILKSQQLKGSYNPKFYDIQAYASVNLTKSLTLNSFANYNISRFMLVPSSRETVFGTITQQYRLRVDYEGLEDDRYNFFSGAVSVDYKPSNLFKFQWINSSFFITEQENFNIEGRYLFYEEGNNDAEFGNVRANRGFGTEINYGRNRLDFTILSSEIRASFSSGKSFWESGLRVQSDKIYDRFNEFSLIDSAGYSIPSQNHSLNLFDGVNAGNKVETIRTTAFMQNTYQLSRQVMLIGGVRYSYNSTTGENLFSPRISARYIPDHSNIRWRFAIGAYHQPPFFREFRGPGGELNTKLKSQKSIHIIAGSDYLFTNKSKTDLKLGTDVYYKKLDNLIPYKVDNLRVRYLSNQCSHGYAAGVDFSLTGQFVEGLGSSFKLSLMKTEEDIEGDVKTRRGKDGSLLLSSPGFLKRPTDQRLNFSAFFQDELFNNPSYQVHLSMQYGSALPTGPPKSERYDDVFKIPAYRRVDIGFTKDLLKRKAKEDSSFSDRYFNSLSASIEVFNLLNINNTVSYLWIKDVSNNSFAVPNYLTSRRVNFKIIAKIKNK